MGIDLKSTSGLRACLLLAALLLFNGCAREEQLNRPDRYSGGQYYGDAVHGDQATGR